MSILIFPLLQHHQHRTKRHHSRGRMNVRLPTMQCRVATFVPAVPVTGLILPVTTLLVQLHTHMLRKATGMLLGRPPSWRLEMGDSQTVGCNFSPNIPRTGRVCELRIGRTCFTLSPVQAVFTLVVGRELPFGLLIRSTHDTLLDLRYDIHALHVHLCIAPFPALLSNIVHFSLI